MLIIIACNSKGGKVPGIICVLASKVRGKPSVGDSGISFQDCPWSYTKLMQGK